jgi:hypothetical protein
LTISHPSGTSDGPTSEHTDLQHVQSNQVLDEQTAEAAGLHIDSNSQVLPEAGASSNLTGHEDFAPLENFTLDMAQEWDAAEMPDWDPTWDSTLLYSPRAIDKGLAPDQQSNSQG